MEKTMVSNKDFILEVSGSMKIVEKGEDLELLGFVEKGETLVFKEATEFEYVLYAGEWEIK